MAFDDLLSLFGGTAPGGSLFGAPGVGQLFGDMAVPGMPATGGGGILGSNPAADMPAANAQVAEYIIPKTCLLYTSPSPRDGLLSRMPSSA